MYRISMLVAIYFVTFRCLLRRNSNHIRVRRIRVRPTEVAGGKLRNLRRRFLLPNLVRLAVLEDQDS